MTHDQSFGMILIFCIDNVNFLIPEDSQEVVCITQESRQNTKLVNHRNVNQVKGELIGVKGREGTE